MELLRVDAKEFANTFPRPQIIYNSVKFTQLNRYKCDETAFLLFRDTRLRGGLILGLRQGIWRSPFSAPFGGLLLTRGQRVNEIEEMWRLALDFSMTETGPDGNLSRGLQTVLSPEFYDADLYAKSVNVLTRIAASRGGELFPEINYHIDLRGLSSLETEYSRSALEKLRQARRSDYVFEQLPVTPENIAVVYDVIHRNREHRGFPHNMSLEQVIATSSVVKIDLFVLRLDGVPVAAVQAHRVAPRIVQVVYWGDLPGYSDKRPMNLLPVELAAHYLAEGDVDIIDIGHSTEDGVPNYGLCEFKESVGCRASLKWGFRIC